MLAHEDAEYMGTLVNISKALGIVVVERTLTRFELHIVVEVVSGNFSCVKSYFPGFRGCFQVIRLKPY